MSQTSQDSKQYTNGTDSAASQNKQVTVDLP